MRRNHCTVTLNHLTTIQLVGFRFASTQPSLSVLSWSVDSSHRSFFGAPRRASWKKRLPHIAGTIADSMADVVALQDCEVDDGLVAALEPRFSLILSAPNGKFGHVAVFAKSSSSSSATASDSSSSSAAKLAPQNWTVVGDKCRPYCSVRLSPMMTTRGQTAATSSLTLTCADLTQRGTSLGGVAFAARPSSAFSKANASTSTVRVSDGQDPLRGMALDLLTQSIRPDIIVGNLVLKTGVQVSGYRDAWVSAGSPTDAMLTTDTIVLNRFYFRGEAGKGKRHQEDATTPTNTTELPRSSTEASGRYQRCLVRHLSEAERPYHLLSRFKSVQTMVLKPTPLEGDQGITFFPSDQFPLLTIFS